MLNIMPKNIAFTGSIQPYKANKNMNSDSANLQRFMLSSLPMIPVENCKSKGNKLNLIA